MLPLQMQQYRQQRQQGDEVDAFSASGNGWGGSSSALHVVQVEFTEPSLGLKIKPSPTLPELIAVTGFAPGGPNGPLPAEASGKIRVGMLLVQVNGRSLWGLSFQDVAGSLKAAAQAVANDANSGQGAEVGGKLMLTLAEPPDVRVHFSAPPNDLILARIQTRSQSSAAGGRVHRKDDGYSVVVTGFEGQPGPLQVLLGRPGNHFVAVGDTLLSANGRPFPGPSGSSYRQEVMSLRDAAYPLSLEFVGAKRVDGKANGDRAGSTLDDGVSGGVVQRAIFTVTIAANPAGKLGVVFGCGSTDGRPVVRRFDTVPGVASRSGLVRPGMVLLAVGERAVDSGLATAAVSASADLSATSVFAAHSTATLTVEQCTELMRNGQYPATPMFFRDMEKYLALRRMFSGSDSGSRSSSSRGNS